MNKGRKIFITKVCTICNLEKDGEKFYYGRKKCIECYTREKRKKYRANANRDIEKAKKWAIKNKDKVREYARIRNLRRHHGISDQEHQTMLKKCNNKCEICGMETKLCVDHNHRTGKIRGLLCSNCNFAIGHLKDDYSIIESAIGYLEFYKEKECYNHKFNPNNKGLKRYSFGDLKVCEICLYSHTKFVIDHDHSSGMIRGQLCGNCNIGIGLFKDNIELLWNAIDYLERTKD